MNSPRFAILTAMTALTAPIEVTESVTSRRYSQSATQQLRALSDMSDSGTTPAIVLGMTNATMKRQQRNINDRLAIQAAIAQWGGLKEPEIAAATGLSEDRVYRIAKAAIKDGWFARNPVNGELVKA